MSFEGLPKDLPAFLGELDRNNEKAWLEANRSRYEESYVGPALALVEALEAPLHRISPHVRVVAKKSGGSIKRIHRDVRFSKDKRPYDPSLTLRFGHARDPAGPGFYLRVEPREVHVGTGVWRPDPKALARIRTHVAENPARWRKVRDRKAFREAFPELGGESLVRVPRGFPTDHPCAEDLKRKDFAAFGTRPISFVTRKDLPAALARDYRASSPFVAFLCEALDLPW